VGWYTSARAEAPDVAALADKARKSLVLVEYTLRNVNVSRDESGQGIVVSKDGVVVIAGSCLPEALPKEWTKDLKVRLPSKRFTTVPATLLGRTPDRLFAYVKTSEPIDVPPLDIAQTADLRMGQQVFATALLGKAGGYEAYTGYSRIRAVMHVSHTLGIVQLFGLTRANSPVYDLDTGNLVGLTFPPISETVTLTMDASTMRVQLKDEDQSAAILPWEEIKDVLTNVPNKPFESPRPWLGLDGLTGLEEEVRAKYGLQEQAGVAVGNVIPDMPADKAGLQGHDIIVTVNGKPFSDSPVPEYMVSHLQRVLENLKISSEAKLGILRAGEKKEITVKVLAAPKIGADMAHIFNAKIGIVTRDLVFGDTYSRKLPADQKGVMVALVKQGDPASLGNTPLRGNYLITKVNGQAVDTQKQFDGAVTTAVENADNREVVFLVILPDGKTQVCRIDLAK